MNIKELTIKDVFKYAVIIIMIVIALRFLYPQLQKFWNQIKKQAEQKTVEEIENLVDTKKLSYPLAKYQLFADSLFTAMDGLGTNLEAVGNVFNQINNINDLYQLIATFGVKKDENLPQWIQGDLSWIEIRGLNLRLTEKGINYQF